MSLCQKKGKDTNECWQRLQKSDPVLESIQTHFGGGGGMNASFTAQGKEGERWRDCGSTDTPAGWESGHIRASEQVSTQTARSYWMHIASHSLRKPLWQIHEMCRFDLTRISAAPGRISHSLHNNADGLQSVFPRHTGMTRIFHK